MHARFALRLRSFCRLFSPPSPLRGSCAQDDHRTHVKRIRCSWCVAGNNWACLHTSARPHTWTMTIEHRFVAYWIRRVYHLSFILLHNFINSSHRTIYNACAAEICSRLATQWKMKTTIFCPFNIIVGILESDWVIWKTKLNRSRAANITECAMHSIFQCNDGDVVMRWWRFGNCHCHFKKLTAFLWGRKHHQQITKSSHHLIIGLIAQVAFENYKPRMKWR